MPLGNPKMTSAQETNWCVVLEALASEIDKKKVALKISHVFSISEEDAMDIVSSTPIILLDGLSRITVEKIKNYFHAAGAKTLITNDAFQKRKYYRTLWPSPPSLAFLEERQPCAEALRDPQALTTDDALNAIRHLSGSEDPSSPSASNGSSFPTFSQEERIQLRAEVERWRQAHKASEEELMRLRHEKNQWEKKRSVNPNRPLEGEQLIKEHEMELKNLKVILAQKEEKYAVLREEYRQARGLFEEKISALDQEKEKWVKKVRELDESCERLKEEKERLQGEVQQKGDLCRRVEEEKAKMRSLMEEGFSQSTEAMEQWKEKLEKEMKKVQDLELAKQEWEKNRGRFLEELERRSQEIQQLEDRNLELEKRVAELHHSCRDQEKMIRDNLQQLEGCQRELEGLRRKVDQLNAEVGDREFLEQKIQLTSLLAEKGAHLKGLVKEQERIEMEIRNREEAIRKILVEQETVEREIMETKQAERRLTENLKKEVPSEGSFPVLHISAPLGESAEVREGI